MNEPMTSTSSTAEWTLEEKVRLLEMYIDKDSVLWEDRVNSLQQAFKDKRPANFFSTASVKHELSQIFNKPNPEHHIHGFPQHPRGIEAAKLWLTHFRKEIEEGRERRKQMFVVALRKQLDLIRRFQRGKLPQAELDAILLEARERDAQRPNAEEHEALIKRHMAKVGDAARDIVNVRTFSDYFQLLMGERIPPPVKSPSPVKTPPELAIEDFELPLKEVQNWSKDIEGEEFVLKSKSAEAERESSDEEFKKSKIIEETEEETTVHISLDKTQSDREAFAFTKLPLSEFERKELQTKEPKVAKINEEFTLKKREQESKPIEHIFPDVLIEYVSEVFQSVSEEKTTPTLPQPTKPQQQRLSRTLTSIETPKEKAKLKRKSTEVEKIEAAAKIESSPATITRRKTRQTASASDTSGEMLVSPEVPNVPDEMSPVPSPSKPPQPQLTPSVKSPLRVLRSHTTSESPQKVPQQTDKVAGTRKRKRPTESSEGDSSSPSPVKLPAKMPRRQTPKQKTPTDDAAETVPEMEEKPEEEHPPVTIETPPKAEQKAPKQPIISEVATTAKLRSSLRRAAIASASPTVDADTGLFLRPGKHTSDEKIPKQILLTLWKDIHQHRYSSVFSSPVTEQQVQGYHSAIKQPMDLRTLRNRIESGAIQTFGQFSQAIVLMFANAVMYNSTGHYANSNAKEMLAYSLKTIEVIQFPGGQFHFPSSSRQSIGGSSSDGGKIPPTLSWASGMPLAKHVRQQQQAEAQSSSAIKNEETDEPEEAEGEVRRLFQRRPYRNKRYTLWNGV